MTRNIPAEAFIAAQLEIRHGRATIASCGYVPRTQAEQKSLEICERAAKRRQHRMETPPAPPADPKLSLRQLVEKACAHPSGGIPIGRMGWPPANAMVKRAIRKGYATLDRVRGIGGCSNYTRLIPTDKGRSFAARG